MLFARTRIPMGTAGKYLAADGVVFAKACKDAMDALVENRFGLVYVRQVAHQFATLRRGAARFIVAQINCAHAVDEGHHLACALDRRKSVYYATVVTTVKH
jgi:hypothetical protein